MKEIKRYKPPITKLISHRDVPQSIRNMASHMVITLYGHRLTVVLIS